MKKLILLLLVGWAWPTTAQPQQVNSHDTEKLIEKKLNFIRERLLLNDAQFKAFAPVFRQYEHNRMELARRRRNLIRNLRNERLARLTDNEVAQRLDQIMDIDEQLFAMKISYYKKLKKILPPRKILALFHADNQFRRILLQRRRNKQNQKPHQPRHRGNKPQISPSGPQNPM